MTMSMSSVSIDRVELLEPLPESIRELNLERPVPGSEWNGTSVEVSGWVLGKSKPPVHIEILQGGQPIRRIPVHQRRLDVARRSADVPGAERSEFTGMVSTLGLPTELRLELTVVLDDGSRQLVALLEGRRTPVRPDFEPTMQPVMVTTLDRMASTWMMSLLAAHPQVVTLRKYPYECHTAKYWLQVLATLTEPTMQTPDAENAHADRWRMGVNPFFLPDLMREPKPGVGLYSDRMAAVCQRNIDSWYSELAFHQVKEGVRYFAEKMTPNHLQAMMWELYPEAKEVFLVRDFRDWICSILAFDAKQAFPGFRRREDESTAAYVRRYGRYAFDLHSHWQARRGAAHLVRYEDLVHDPEPTLRALFEYVGIDATPSSVESALREASTESESFPRHHTSFGARDSVGRWRRGLTPELSDVVQELFADVLRSFGYDGETTEVLDAAEPTAVAPSASSTPSRGGEES